MPGGIRTGLQKFVPKEIIDGWAANPAVLNFMKNTEQGASTTVVAAVSKEWEGRGGKYLEDCAEAPIATPESRWSGVKKYAYDEEKENRLWELTLQMLGIERA